jgi:hypothetical protein
MGRANLSEQIKVAVGIVCRVANLEVYAVDGECVLDVHIHDDGTIGVPCVLRKGRDRLN